MQHLAFLLSFEDSRRTAQVNNEWIVKSELSLLGRFAEPERKVSWKGERRARFKEKEKGNFPDSPVSETLSSQGRGPLVRN